jgi:SSS family solute:Na+ symporter
MAAPNTDQEAAIPLSKAACAVPIAFIIVGIVIAYILFTTWLTFRIRSKNSGDFMEGSRWKANGGAQHRPGGGNPALKGGLRGSDSGLGADIFNTGKITISGAIAEKYGTSTKNIISIIMIYALLLVNVGNYVLCSMVTQATPFIPPKAK